MNTKTRTPVIDTPLATPSPGSPASNGLPNPSGHVVLLSLLAPKLPEVIATPTPFVGTHYGDNARITEELSNYQRQRDEEKQELEQKQREFPAIPKFLELDAVAKMGILLCVAAILFMSGVSWFSGALFVEQNFTESIWRGLVFCGVIPAIPFVFKYFFLCFAGRRRLLMEFVLLGIFLIGFFVFADQFGQHFARKPGIDITAPAFDFGGDQSAQASFIPDASGPVLLRWFFYGQLIIECIASFVFFTWLMELLAPRPNPDKATAANRIAHLLAHRPELDRIIAGLRGKLAELQHHKADYDGLKSVLTHLFK